MILPKLITPIKITPANGINLNYINAGEAPVCQVTVLLPAGAVSSSLYSPAVAALSAECICEGSKGYPGEKLSEILDYNGAWLRTSVSSHYMQIVLSTPSETLFEVLPAFIDCITRPTFEDKSVAMLRKRAASVREYKLECVEVLSYEAALKLLVGPDSPHTIFPSPEDILAIDRSQLVGFHKMALDGGDIHVFMAGRYPEEAVDFLAKLLAESFSPNVGKSQVISPVKYPKDTPNYVEVPAQSSVQSSLTSMIPAPARSHPDYINLRIAVNALGGYFGSRLMSNIREDKGLTYHINSLLIGSRDLTFTQINAQFDPLYTDDVNRELRYELLNLIENPPCGDELRHVKFALQTSLARNIDSYLKMMDQYVLPYTVGVPADYLQRHIDAIEKITPEIISSVAARYLNPDNAKTAITTAL